VALAITALALCTAWSVERTDNAGRFRIDTMPSHVFVTDTATGRTWQEFSMPSAGSTSAGFGEAKAPRATGHGRYSLAMTAGHAYLLDTATGEVWETFAPEGSGSTDAGFDRPKL